MSSTLLEVAAAFFERHGLTAGPGVVAISGGPDSVALAHVCVTFHRQERLDITLAHLNHKLRGAESDGDEAFVRDWCAQWSLPTLRCVTAQVDVAAQAQETGDNLENTARRVRYAWLTETARKVGAAWVATGHTADDQAETVLHHFLRGSGVQGLGGIPETRPLAPDLLLVRPLLTSRRQDVLDYLHDYGLAFRHDSSNDDPRFLRNRLRHDLLPQLVRDYNPGLVDILSRTAQQAREVQEELTRQATALLGRVELPRAGDMVVLGCAEMQAAPRVVLREMFRVLWQRESWPMGEMNFEDWERLADLSPGDFPGRVTARRAAKVLQVCKNGEPGA